MISTSPPRAAGIHEFEKFRHELAYGISYVFILTRELRELFPQPYRFVEAVVTECHVLGSGLKGIILPEAFLLQHHFDRS